MTARPLSMTRTSPGTGAVPASQPSASSSSTSITAASALLFARLNLVINCRSSADGPISSRSDSMFAGPRYSQQKLPSANPQAAARKGKADLSVPDNSQKGVEIPQPRSEEHTSELQSLMRISYAVFCLKKKKQTLQTK